jgi:hypothetical protein
MGVDGTPAGWRVNAGNLERPFRRRPATAAETLFRAARRRLRSNLKRIEVQSRNPVPTSMFQGVQPTQ